MKAVRTGLARLRREPSILLFIALIALIWFRYEPARDTANEVNRIVTQSACKVDPKGDECQQILTDSIKAFDRETSCVLARKVGVPCERKKGGAKAPQSNAADSSSTDGGSDGDPTRTPSGSRPTGEPEPPDSAPPGGGDGGDGGDGNPDGEPPTTNPPGTPPDGPGPSPAPSSPSTGDQIDHAVDQAADAVDDITDHTCSTAGVHVGPCR